MLNPSTSAAPVRPSVERDQARSDQTPAVFHREKPMKKYIFIVGDHYFGVVLTPEFLPGSKNIRA